MRLVKTALILVGALGWACGGASHDGLFGGSTTSCTPGSQCNFGATPGAGGSALGGFTSAGGGSQTGGLAGTGAESATGGFIGAGGGSPTGGTFGSGGAGSGGVGGLEAGGSSSGGIPQTFPDAGQGGTGGVSPPVCPTGHFTGMLQGPYKSLTGTSDIGASIDFSVNINGSVTGTFTGPGPAKATLNGSVDCSTGVLTVNIENGTYPGVLGGTTKFSGTLGGQYNVDASAFVSGTWTITESSNKTNGGTGTWS